MRTTLPHAAARLLLGLILGLLAAPAAWSANFVVNSSDDLDDGACNVGHCSLREAINAANLGVGPDLITFALGSATISPTSALPILTGGGTTIRGDGDIALDGSSAGSTSGLRIESDGNKVQGLEIQGFSRMGVMVGHEMLVAFSAHDNVVGVDGDGVGDDLERNVIHSNGIRGVQLGGNDVTGNVVAGNYVGIDKGGKNARPNGGGVSLRRASDNRIGTNGDAVSDDLERNVIGANGGHGVSISGGSHDNTVAGNYIGFAADGSEPLGNDADGVNLSIADFNTIGPGNVIGNNRDNGVALSRAAWNRVISNVIGTDVTQTRDSGNGFNGVRIFGSFEFPSNNNWIGVTSGAPGGGAGPLVGNAGNVIVNSEWNGIFIDSHVENTRATDNALMFNSIHSNNLLGIDLVSSACPVGGCTDGVTLNDIGDTDGGGNDALNFPVVTSSTTGSSTTYVFAEIRDGLPNRPFTIQFFSNTECDPDGHGEGETYLGQVDTSTNGAGDAIVFAAIPVSTTLGDYVTSTATQRGLLGLFPVNTSEFSACSEIRTGTFMAVADSISDILVQVSENGMMDGRWAALLGARVDRTVRFAERGQTRAARAQLGVFEIFVRILEWRGVVTPEVAQPLLTSSRAAQQLLNGERHPPRGHRRHGR